jgi:hypothetical protein
MNNKKIFCFAAIGAIALLSVEASRTSGSPALEQDQPARCAITVPNSWGEYIGAGSYGLEFKDDAGTIRFVKQFPCGLEGAPNVSLEIHRK